MRKLLFLLLAAFVVTAGSSCKGKTETFYKNPVIQGDLPDPTIIRTGDKYYIAGTSSEWAPFFPIYESEDLVNWTQTGHVFETKPEWTANSFWAPEFFYHNDSIYCYYSASEAETGIVRIGVATAKSPTDKFTDHGIVVAHGKEAIDAFIFDDNGQLYITWKAYGLEFRPIEIVAAKLSDDGLKVVGEPVTLLVDDERIGMEGQYHFKKGDYYYIVYAARGCCGPGSDYETRVARSKNFLGPYEKYEGNPILWSGGKDSTDFTASGHGTAATTPDGRMFFVCHGYLRDNFYQGRVPIMQEMYVGEDNWVHFTTGDTASIMQPMPFKKTVQKPAADFKDDFDGKKLDPAWAWNYVYSDIDFKLNDGELLLGGTPKTGNINGTVLCLRPLSPNYYVETEASKAPEGFVGITMYGDEKHMINWGLQNGKLKLVKISGDKEEVSAEFDYGLDEVYLKMTVKDGHMHTFSWSNDGEVWTEVQNVEIDGRDILLWNRVARPGMIFNGPAGQYGEFSFFTMAQM